MSGPITWRTVNGPSLAEASRPLEAAQRAFDNTFTGLGDALKQWDAGQKDIWKQQDAAATQDVLSQIYRAKTIDEFNALRNSGALDQATAANGAVIDRAAVNALADGRTSILQNRDVQGITYKNTMLDDAQAADVRRIGMLTLTDPKAAEAALAARPDLRAAVQLAQGIDSRSQTLIDRDRATTRFGYEQTEEERKKTEEAFKQQQRPLLLALEQGKVDNIPLQREQLRAQINSSNASTAASNESVLTSRANRDRIEAEAEKARKLKMLGAALDGNIYKEGVYKDTNSVDIAKLMKDTGAGADGPDDNDQRRKVLERLNKLAQTGIELEQVGLDGKPVKTTVPLPLGAVKAALLSSGDRLLSWNEGYADSFEQNLKARLQASYSRPGADGRPIAANRALDDYQAFQAIMRSGAEIAPAPSGKKK
jgi:hypothetical protein